MFEIHYKTIAVRRVWHLLPSNPGGILSLAVHERFCVCGCEDGVLRVWPLNFTATLMEAGTPNTLTLLTPSHVLLTEHDGPVCAVDVSEDGLKILAGTEAVSLS